MRSSSLFFVLVAASVGVAAGGSLLQRHIEDFKFSAFKRMHGRVYATPFEEDVRRNIFVDRLRRVEAHNADPEATYRQTAFHPYGDLTTAEFVRARNGFRQELRAALAEDGLLAEEQTEGGLLGAFRLPSEVDWRKKGAVTPVKDQGHCGSCWAFSITGALEGMNYLKTGKLVSLSEQQLLDCSSNDEYHNGACLGGYPDSALQYVIDNGGIEGESDYPYVNRDDMVPESCRFNRSEVRATEKSMARVRAGSEMGLQRAVAATGPVSVCIDANHDSFMNYHSGVYQNEQCSDSQLDHAVLAVGYGTDADTGLDYWLVKNSWAETWGEDGYVRMVRNKDNACGIATQAVYPLV